MIQRCQSRFAFSRLGWYTTAIKALIPDKELAAITTRSIRPFANLTSTIVKTELEDVATTSTTIPVSLSRNIPQIVQPSVVPVVSVQRVSATPENVEYHRCAGFKKSDGRRCNRLVRVESVSASADQAYHYCHDHLPHPIADKDRRDNRGGKHTEAESLPFAEKKKPANVPVTEKDRLATPVKVPGSQKIYDCWDLWITPRISRVKREMIKQEMQRPLSIRDKPGYIYAYQLNEGRLSGVKNFAYLKIGRTTDPHRRMYQIANTCDLVPKIIELFPSFPKSNGPMMPNNLEALEEEVLDLPKCPLSHRVERLIHLELLGLCSKAEFKCPKCGCTHREWFKVRRGKMPDGRMMTDQELYTLKVRPIILKWIQYGVAASVFLANNKPLSS